MAPRRAREIVCPRRDAGGIGERLDVLERIALASSRGEQRPEALGKRAGETFRPLSLALQFGGPVGAERGEGYGRIGGEEGSRMGVAPCAESFVL